MKLFIIYLSIACSISAVSQKDSTSNFQNRWSKIKNKAKEKSTQFKTSLDQKLNSEEKTKNEKKTSSTKNDKKNREENSIESLVRIEENKWRVVTKNGKFGIRNEKQDLIIPIKYDKIKRFKNGFSWVVKDEKWLPLDSTGKVYNNLNFDFVTDFNHKNASVKEGKKIGFIDKQLAVKWIYENNEYDFIYDANKAYVVKKEDGMMGLISLSGKIILAPKYYIDRGLVYENDLLIVSGKDKLYGLYKLGYGWVTERVYTSAEIDFTDTYENTKRKRVKYYIIKQNVNSKNKYTGKVSNEGKITWIGEVKAKITPPNPNPKVEKLPWRKKYKTKFRVLENALIPVKDGATGKHGLIDSEGNIIVEPKYYDIDIKRDQIYYLYTKNDSAIPYDHSKKKYYDPVAFKINVGKKEYLASINKGRNTTAKNNNNETVQPKNPSPQAAEIYVKNNKKEGNIHVFWSEKGRNKEKTIPERYSSLLGYLEEGTKLYYTIGNSRNKIFVYEVQKGEKRKTIEIN